jgi:hypothetical protein
MISLIRKLIKEQSDRYFRRDHRDRGQCRRRRSPIGDVTTTMLWIGGQTPR